MGVFLSSESKDPKSVIFFKMEMAVKDEAMLRQSGRTLTWNLAA